MPYVNREDTGRVGPSGPLLLEDFIPFAVIDTFPLFIHNFPG